MKGIKAKLEEELNRIIFQKEKIKSSQESQRLFEILIQLATNIPYNSIQSYPRPNHPEPEKKS